VLTPAATPPAPTRRGLGAAAQRGLLAVAYAAVYARTLAWGWLGMDDSKFLHRNPHLGLSWAGLRWALTNVTGAQRWMPVMWLSADLVPKDSPQGLRLLSFGVGLAACLLVFELLRRAVRPWAALPLGLLFALSPLRLEVFADPIGFIYGETLVWLLLAVRLRHRRGWAVLCLALAALTYPQAAGGWLLFLWAWRRSGWGLALVLGLAALAIFQMQLRLDSRFGDFSPTPGFLPLALCHLLLTAVWPFATVPIFPCTWYPALVLGGAAAVAWAVRSWRTFLITLLVASPTLLASVTEPFSFSGRYSLLFAVAALWFAGRGLGRLVGPYRRYAQWGLYGLAAVFALMNVGDIGMRSRRDSVLQLQYEGRLVGLYFIPGDLRQLWGPNGPPPP